MSEDRLWFWARVVAVLLVLVAVCAWIEPELFGLE
jgi:hypothetical protein